MAAKRDIARGFTLVEALVSMSITAVAGTALLLGLSSALRNTGDCEDLIVGQGMAQQLMDEIAGKVYCAADNNPYETNLGCSATEAAGPGRSKYNDIDDFNGVSTKPATDLYGVVYGLDDGQGGQRHPNFRAYAQLFTQWRQQVTVYYVSPSNFTVPLGSNQTSDYRAIEVRITIEDPVRGTRQVGYARRVVAYIPPPG